MSHRQLVETALARFAEPSQRDQYFDLYSGSTVLHGYGIEPGLESVKSYYAGVWAAFPDAKVEVEQWIEVDDIVVMRFTLRGTHEGPVLGVEPSGRPVAVPGMTILRFENERCVERWSVTDGLALLIQVGAFNVGRES